MSDQNVSGPLAELQQLRLLVGDVAAGLQGQREILRMRGMGLPPASLQMLKAINDDLIHLQDRLTNDATELEQLRTLAETSAMINSSFDLDEVLNTAMDEVINLTGAERGYLILRDDVTGELEFRIARDETDQRSNGSAPVSYSVLNQVLNTGESLLADNAQDDPRMKNQESVASLVLRSVLCVPLKYKGAIIGAVYVDNRLREGIFGVSELNLLNAFANQAAVAIENARLYARIQESLTEITEMKDLMDNVFASIGSGVITTNATDMITMYNRAASEILRRTPDTALGQPLHKVLPKISADFENHLQAVRNQNQSEVIETELDVVDRGRIALNMKLSPLKDGNQQTQGVAMVLDDITDQRDREETLALVRRYLPPALVDNIHSIAQLGLGGERREVTCMFVDVRPLYTMPPNFRPQQVMETINVYLSVATDIIHTADGVIDKYMGNEIMVLFNTQLNPQEDHALRAVEAGLALRETFIELYRQWNIDPDPHYYRLGIHTGVATMGNVGSVSRRDFTAIGDTINLTKRLEENAKLGQIILSDDTYSHMMATVHCKPEDYLCVDLEPIQVKGRTQSTRIYEVFRS